MKGGRGLKERRIQMEAEEWIGYVSGHGLHKYTVPNGGEEKVEWLRLSSMAMDASCKAYGGEWIKMDMQIEDNAGQHGVAGVGTSK
jgi:hypothetical protein